MPDYDDHDKFTKTVIDPADYKDVLASILKKNKKEEESQEPRDEIQEAIELFNRYRFDDLVAYQPDPRHFLAGNGFIKRGAGTLLTGGTGLGKSVLAEQFGVNLASGTDILGVMKVPKPVKVLYIECENDEEVLKRDILSIVEATGADSRLVQENFVIYHSYGLSGRKFAAWLKTVCEFERPDVIMIDPYQSYIGGSNINDSSSFLRWIEPIDDLIKKQMIGLFLVAHTPKPTDRDDWNPLQGVYAAAGTSTLANWARRSCELMTVGKDTSRFKLTFSKNAASTGIRDPRWPGIVRELFVSHSHNIDKPSWRISDDQDMPNKSNGAKGKIVRAMLKHPDGSQSLIAAMAGVSKSMVCKRWSDCKEEAEKQKKKEHK